MMTRVLVACLLAGILIQPAAAGPDPAGIERNIHRLHHSEAVGLISLNQPAVSWVRGYASWSGIAIRPLQTTLSVLNGGTGRTVSCSQKLALGSDTRCISACDASRESCEGRCGSARSTCMAQCPILGFACDYYCQAAYLVCKANCGKARDSCVTSCPPKGGDKES